MTIDIEKTRAILTNALLTSKGDEYVNRRTFSMLMPKIQALRNKSLSFEQITAILAENGFTISILTARAFYNELLIEQMIALSSQVDEQMSFFNSLVELTEAPLIVDGGGLHCLPLRHGVKRLERRDNVPEEVYMDCQLEHPAIPGLLLSRDDRLYSEHLEITDANGDERFETFVEFRFRIIWKKPIPKWVSRRTNVSLT